MYVEPFFKRTAFTCPTCQVYANQVWEYPFKYEVNNRTRPIAGFMSDDIPRFWYAICACCNKQSYWLDSKMIFPLINMVDSPNEDLNDDIKKDYLEAASILQFSPRGAAAIIRLAIQKLCVLLGEPGKNINDDIASLVKKGLSPQIKQALDYVRVVGNNAVHPGEIDLNDDATIAQNLFKLLNMVADKMITEPRKVQELYDSLPDGAKNAIDRRDSK